MASIAPSVLKEIIKVGGRGKRKQSFQDYLQLCKELEASLVYMKPCLKNDKGTKTSRKENELKMRLLLIKCIG